ncbi:MAG: sugar ABC transporter permease [Thermomicrobiales bacterium]|nr:sugar ABC transporter permease [Thermomicrobiales bacterium]
MMQSRASAMEISAAPPNRMRRQFNTGRMLTVAAFLLPSIALYSLLVFYPLFRAAYYGMFDWNGLGPLTDNVGIDNFRNVLSDGLFRKALRHNVTILLLSLLIQLPLAIVLAILASGNIRGRAFFRTVFFLPYVLSEVVTAVIWSFLLQPNSGINDVLERVIPGFKAVPWLGDPDIVLYVVFVVITWRFIGFHIVLYLAGLQGIPAELTDAAKLDGASPLRVVFDVVLPLLGPTIRISVFLSVIGSLQFFDLIWVMTQGGPVNATETMATYMYKYSFQRFEIGYGAAVSLVIFGICFGFALLYQRFVLSRDYDNALA